MTQIFTDRPKSLADDMCRQNRIELLSEPHIKPLIKFVQEIRTNKGPNYSIPFFDPLDGGVRSKILFVLLAPGPQAVKSGFISRNNPDLSAKNMFELLAESGFSRYETVLWNIVPWYIGNEKKIRPPVQSEIVEGSFYLERLMDLLPNLEAIVLVGEKAWKAEKLLKINSRIRVFNSNHPSPLFVNRKPGNKFRILTVFQMVRTYVSNSTTNFSNQ